MLMLKMFLVLCLIFSVWFRMVVSFVGMGV